MPEARKSVTSRAPHNRVLDAAIVYLTRPALLAIVKAEDVVTGLIFGTRELTNLGVLTPSEVWERLELFSQKKSIVSVV